MEYELVYYRWLLFQIMSWLQDKPDLAEDLIYFIPETDRGALKELLRSWEETKGEQ